MRIFGIVLIVIGIIMAIVTGFNYKTEKNIIDAGPVKINKEETRHIGWPTYTGGLIALVGLGLVAAGAKKK